MPAHRIPVPLGTRFGSLVVVSKDGAGWLCRCDCGNSKTVKYGHLHTGFVESCGKCGLRLQRLRPRVTKHGKSKSKVYYCWLGMKARCLNPSEDGWKNYGGRGIKICTRWLDDFKAFYADMGEPPAADSTIERIDVNGDYCPDNCIWLPRRLQARNTRVNRIITVAGESRTLAEWAESTGIAYNTLCSRLRDGWLPEHVVTTPLLYAAQRGQRGA